MPQKKKIVFNNTSNNCQKTDVKSPPILCRQKAFNFSIINYDSISIIYNK